MKAKRTSLEDIARAVGVSKATVSFVLNGKGDDFNISKEKQQLIKDKAKELAYVPNFFAKSLRQGETKTVGVVVSDISNPLYAELCKTIQEELHNKGYNVFIVNTNEDKSLEINLMRELIQRSIDGMIISPSNKIESLIPILNETHIPVVFADRPGDDGTDYIGVDNYEETRRLVKQFSIKPKKLAIIVKNNNIITTLEHRVKGAIAACEEDGIPYEIVNLSLDQDHANITIKALLDQQCDAFLALNNVVALRTIAGLRQQNITFGKEVRLICFEESELFEFIEPGITALKQPTITIGKNAVERLYSRLKEQTQPGQQEVLHCELVLRKSH